MTLTPEIFETTARALAEALINYAKKAGSKKHPITDVKVIISTGSETNIEIEKGQTSNILFF